MHTAHPVSPALLAEAMSPEAYQHLFEELVAQGATTGLNQSAFMVDYTKLNLQRTKRVQQQLKLADALQRALAGVHTPWHWLIISEIWFGDAAQSLPVILACARAQPLISVRVLLRDDYPEVMDAFVGPGGSRAIPVLVCVRATDGALLGTWGPRPQPAQDMVLAHKANPTKPDAELYEDLHRWYAQDRTAMQQAEMAQLITNWSAA